ncbi:hypothetical protein GPECTOR_124g497 [Gonium pectorale]|uniref:Fibronectin type-III domain-containing protein n=1 Tax=Gonium pectorale TaxID=33097 RepID=A0A150FYP0_GONPE|nr:hypothetical protein GPECTOR_124g497 [Gonium pectorale]|eukprot:KXZ42697.1 hypothetical protein GPECTOR_124g497 [Gonium pectorale]
MGTRATPKDGKVLLTWGPPANGGCVSAYVVNVYDPFYRGTTPAQSTSTSGRSAAVEGLANGRPYVFAVQAYNSGYRAGGTAEVTATPSDRCDASAAPGEPTNVRVQTGDGWARLCWDGVKNDACVDEYRLSAKLLSGPDFRTSNDGKISKGGCANITGLQTDAKYSFTVLPYSTGRGAGAPASVSAVVGAAAAAQNGWTCKSVNGCAPNRGGRCNSGGCEGVARRGECGVPAMVDVDWVNKQVTQWCAEACSCQLGQAQGGSLMGVARPLGGLGGFGGFGGGAGGAGGSGFGALGGLGGLGALGGGGSSGGGRNSAGGGDDEDVPESATPSSLPWASLIAAAAAAGGAGASGGNPGGAGGAGLVPFPPVNGGAVSTGRGPLPPLNLPFSSGGPGPLPGPLPGSGGAANPVPGAVAGALLSDWSQTRAGQFVTNMAADYVNSGVIGEAAGKVASQVVSNQVNTMLQSVWNNAAANANAANGRPGAGGRRRLRQAAAAA